MSPSRKSPPARPALAVGELDRQHLTAAVPVDADRDQHRLAGDHAGLAHPLSAVQIEYSLWSRDVEAEIQPLCEELGIGFVAYSPLGRGFLTGQVADIAALRAGDARRNMPRFQGDNLRRNLALVEELKAHAAAENCTPAQLALAWVLSRAPYIVPIPGTSHRHRLEENAAAVSLKISADTEDALLQVFVSGAASGLRYPENHLVRLGI